MGEAKKPQIAALCGHMSQEYSSLNPKLSCINRYIHISRGGVKVNYIAFSIL